MSQRTLKRLRKLCHATSGGDAASAEARFQRLKSGWQATPAPHRAALMGSLEKAASAMAGMMERAAAAGRAAQVSTNSPSTTE